MKTRFWSGTAVLLAALLVVALLAGPGRVAAVGEPPSNTVERQLTATLYPATAISDAVTVYSAASVITRWNSADVFVGVDLTDTTDVTGTVTASAFLTVTVQLSPDGTNWADADYEYATDSTIATKAYVRSLSADGTEYMRVPLAGERLRVKIESTQAVTPTVWVTYRN